MDAATLNEVTELLSRWTLEGVAERICSPLLILHARTTRRSLSKRRSGSTGAPRRPTRPCASSSAHCQNDNRVLAHEEIGAWLGDVFTRP